MHTSDFTPTLPFALSEHPATHYARIAKAIQFLTQHHAAQPSLDELAAHVHLSSAHLQRVFQDWAGVSPKKFVQYLSVQHAKALLAQAKSASAVRKSVGLSSDSRLHDLFVSLEGMTPLEYKNGGLALQISYQFISTPFGQALLAQTDRGVCHLAFCEEGEPVQPANLQVEQAVQALRAQFPHASLLALNEMSATGRSVQAALQGEKPLNAIRLHVRGSDFQLKVWQALLRIDSAQVRSYGQLAQDLDCPRAARAVGTAIGSNPVAYLIPCHRVIQASGVTGGYRWDPVRKKVILAWEQARQAYAA